MADLDDFFAKRDKKKPKGKKFDNADDTSKILETKAKERKKMENLRSTYVAPPTESGEAAPALSEYRQQQVDEDDEWKEVEEHRPDYSNLKIQELVLEDDDDEFGGKDAEVHEDAEDEKNGPWNKVGKDKDKEEPKTDAQTPVETPPVEEKVEETKANDENPETTETSEEAPKKTGGYVPPNRRQAEAKPADATPAAAGAPSETPSAASAYIPPSRRGQSAASVTGGSKKKPTAPLELTDESFPSLGS